jgi:hypothetical protein
MSKLSRNLRELVEWLILGMFLGCIPHMHAGTTMPSEKDFGDRKAMLIFKPCPDNKADVCAVPILNPMFRIKLEKGEQPKIGQAVQCEVTKKKTLDCGHGLEMKLESVILQAQ